MKFSIVCWKVAKKCLGEPGTIVEKMGNMDLLPAVKELDNNKKFIVALSDEVYLYLKDFETGDLVGRWNPREFRKVGKL